MAITDSYEYVLTRQPFVVRRRARWGDCDPAGVVYTGKFTEYLLGAVMHFFAEIGDGNYMKWIESIGVDTPCKGMDLDFHHALWPEDEFDMTCTIGEIREHSFDILVAAVRADGKRAFSGRFSPICIGRTVRARTPIPGVMRQRLMSFQK
jgi:acyl-CoA thioesterase FadM